MAAARLKIRACLASDAEEVAALWSRCGLVVPWNVPEEDIAAKLAFQPELFFVAEWDGALIGSVMAGYDGHRGWINYLAVTPDRRGEGHARALMEHAEAVLRGLGCPKINLQVRSSNREVIEFYQKLGFHDDRVTSLGKRLDGKAWG